MHFSQIQEYHKSYDNKLYVFAFFFFVYKIDIYHTSEALGDCLTLIDVAYIYMWRRVRSGFTVSMSLTIIIIAWEYHSSFTHVWKWDVLYLCYDKKNWKKTLQNIKHHSTHVFFFLFICFDKKKWKKITDTSLNFF